MFSSRGSRPSDNTAIARFSVHARFSMPVSYVLHLGEE